MPDESWSYEKWYNRLEAAIRGTSEEDTYEVINAYEVINDIYATAHTDGYHEGFGDGKVHDCPHIQAECEKSCG